MLENIRILIVDDHLVVRTGLALTLGREPGFTICGEAENVREAVKSIRETQPDLLLADLDLEGGTGLDLIREAHQVQPGLPVLMLSMHPEDIYAERALRAGAKGYLMKSAPASRLIAAIREVIGGGIAVSEAAKFSVLKRLSGAGDKTEGDALSSLSDRELEVFRHIGLGLGTRSIAVKLCLSVKTVETHIAHIKRKLHISSGSELRHKAFHWTRGSH